MRPGAWVFLMIGVLLVGFLPDPFVDFAHYADDDSRVIGVAELLYGLLVRILDVYFRVVAHDVLGDLHHVGIVDYLASLFLGKLNPVLESFFRFRKGLLFGLLRPVVNRVHPFSESHIFFLEWLRLYYNSSLRFVSASESVSSSVYSKSAPVESPLPSLVIFTPNGCSFLLR